MRESLEKGTTQTDQRTADKKTCSIIRDNLYELPERYPLGTLINGSCSSEARLVSWRCTSTVEGDAIWTIERQYKCTGNDALVRIAQVNITNENLLSVLTSVENFAHDAKRISGVVDADIEAAIVILTKIASLLTQHNFRNYLTLILNRTSTIIGQLLLDPPTSLEMNASVKNVPLSIEKLLMASTTLLEDNETMAFLADNFMFQVTSDPGVIGVEIYSNAQKSQDIIKSIKSDGYGQDARADALIYFSAEAKDIKKTFIVYKNAKLFRGKEMRPVNEMILSAELSRRLYNQELVTMHFTLSPTIESSIVTCGSWSYAENEWLTFGCTKKKSAPGLVVCSCNHTANFAVVTSTRRPRPNEKVDRGALTVASRTGLSMSIAILLIVIVTHLTFRNLKKSIIQHILFHVSLSILLLDVIFLAGINNTESRTTCIALAAVLHLCLLSSCGWISVETVFEYIRILYHPADAPEKSHLYAALCTWGLPIIAVATPLIVNSSYYDTKEQGLCWVTRYVLHYGVILPIALCVAVNAIMIGLLITATCTLTDRTARKRLVASIRRCLSLFILTGMSWIFGFLAIEQPMPIFHSLFCIFNIAQGTAILICHGLPAKLVFHTCRRMANNGRNDTRTSVAAARERSFSTRVSVSDTEQATSRF